MLIFAIPNGGLRTQAEAARLKWTGVLAGVPDLAIVAPGGRVCFIEVKQPRGVLSDDQRVIRDGLIALGSPPAICKSIDDARKALAAWGIETNEARSLSANDPIASAFLAGAVRALRRRADRQRAIAKGWTVHGERGAIVVAGEGRVADRIAAALEAAADEIENGGPAS